MVFDTMLCDMLNSRIYGQKQRKKCIIYIKKGGAGHEKNQSNCKKGVVFVL